jgi:hypothetical protein
LNDPASIEIAKGLAARISAEQACVSGDRERLRYAFLLCLGRSPSDRELATLEALLRSESEPDGAMAPAWLTVARVLLNLDEFVTRE